jgi:hypothetical protein
MPAVQDRALLRGWARTRLLHAFARQSPETPGECPEFDLPEFLANKCQLLDYECY